MPGVSITALAEELNRPPEVLRNWFAKGLVRFKGEPVYDGRERRLRLEECIALSLLAELTGRCPSMAEASAEVMGAWQAIRDAVRVRSHRELFLIWGRSGDVVDRIEAVGSRELRKQIEDLLKRNVVSIEVLSVGELLKRIEAIWTEANGPSPDMGDLPSPLAA